MSGRRKYNELRHAMRAGCRVISSSSSRDRWPAGDDSNAAAAAAAATAEAARLSQCHQRVAACV